MFVDDGCNAVYACLVGDVVLMALRQMFVTGKERCFPPDLPTASSTSRVWHVLLVSTRTFCLRRLELYPSLVLCNHRDY
jgi:hypothetical protein